MRILALGFALIVLASCDRAGGDADVRRAALAFLDAVRRDDGAAACAVLAPRAAASLETCPQEVTGLGLQAGPITTAQVWGDRAQVRIRAGGGNTLFLARFPSGWKVTGAGCAPRPRGPYDCDVAA
ncbi:hypothetical protein GCM10010191_90190 [Actinomadura vinacea]|uniref:Lipoprotein n=1 Tax=Actinomadura vinacea TaxID=115336 RepID=A0ABP5XL69_9ACTN